MKNSYQIISCREEAVVDFPQYTRSIAKSWGAILNGNVLVLSLEGSTSDNLWCFASYTALRGLIEKGIADDSVEAIAININSPGGEVAGLFEAAEYIREARNIKPIYAYGEGMVCSAAYAIASSCTKFYASEFTEIGSVGVQAIAFDYSKYDEKRGILSKIFRSKNAENKNLNLFTPEGEEDLQAKIDYYEDCFYEAISLGRHINSDKALDTFGHGMVFMASEAVDIGMADGVSTWDAFLQNLTSSLHESEGEDMDLTKMSAEEKRSLLAQLEESDPSLLAERVNSLVEERLASDRNRISDLNALKDGTNDEIINAAILDGRTSEDIGLELYKLSKQAKVSDVKESNPLEKVIAQAENTQIVEGAPVDKVSEKDSYREKIMNAAAKVAERRK